MILIAVYFIVIAVLIKFLIKITCYMYDGDECLLGKVAIITGGNRGIGFEVTKCLASRGCKVIIGCRSKAENEMRQLTELTNNENIILKYLDLKSFESVRNFVKDIHKTESKIDILINNAGIGVDLNLSADGLHSVMQTNVFSPFLLTHLLADLLKKSDDGRIIFSSSLLALYNKLTLENLNPKDSTQSSIDYCIHIYGNSKLLQIIISNIISEKLKKYGIKSNAVHPGMINTDIWQDLQLFNTGAIFDITVKWIFTLIVFFYSRTPREGAQSIVALAVSNKLKNTTGQFYWGFGMSNIYPNPRSLRNKQFCNEVWKKIESLVKLKQDELL